MATIYLSSTYEDLKDYRRAVYEALRKAGHHVIAMEDYVAADQRPVDKCLKDVETADIYVGLFAFRYGYIPPVQHDNPDGLSITELEYRRAEVLKKPCLTFVVNDTAAWPSVFNDAYAAEDKGERIKTLRQHLLTEKLASKFSAPDELSTLVLAAMTKMGKGGEPNPPAIIHWPDGTPPYRGLQWFNQDYAPLFFGRDREVDELIAKMSEPGGRVLLVIGASGSGKSSVIAAGVWKAIFKGGRLTGSARWKWQRIQPSDGDSPCDAVARGLKEAFQLATRPKVTDTGIVLRDLLHRHLSQGEELILFVDQFEELFTSRFEESDIQSFLELLIGTARETTNRFRVVATIRSEFLGKLEAYESTLNLLNSPYRYHLGPVSPRMLQDMIEKPAAATGYRFEPRLVERILNDTGQEPGNLALVEYALKQLFEMHKNRIFTVESYEAVGGVVGAIATKASEVLSGFEEEVRGAFDTVFAELVHLDRERPPTRRHAAVSTFRSNPAAVQLIEALAGQECRVLVTSGTGQEAVVEVAHEKLFTAWPKLKQWIDESGEALRDIEHAEEEARSWQKGGDNPQELWLVSRAKNVLAGIERFGKHLSPELDRFLRPQPVLIARLNHHGLSHQDRLLIGQKLAEFGDTRPGVGVKDGLPDIVWIEIPGGTIKLEEVDRGFEVKPFRIAKYPVTNEQFEAFLNASDGYRQKTWWKDLERSEESKKPSWSEANCPRETVSWYEAVAFCRWFSAKTGTNIRLPTEWEWQQAAIGGDPTRLYPWKGEWVTTRCNSHESQLGRTTAVGMYPLGATQQGVLDMVGNVWKWCLNTYDDQDLSIDSRPRVIRGGSWRDGPEFLRVSNRLRAVPDSRYNALGFRLIQDIP